MEYDELNSRRFGPFAIAALILGLALGVAMPIGPVAAGVPSDTTATGSAKQALASEAAKTDGVIVVAGTDKNWHNNKNWNNNKQQEGRGGQALSALEQAALLRHHHRWCCGRNHSAVAPAPNLCWYWADPTMTRGYWDYCQ